MRLFRTAILTVLIVYGAALVCWAVLILWNDQWHLVLPWV